MKNEQTILNYEDVYASIEIMLYKEFSEEQSRIIEDNENE